MPACIKALETLIIAWRIGPLTIRLSPPPLKKNVQTLLESVEWWQLNNRHIEYLDLYVSIYFVNRITCTTSSLLRHPLRHPMRMV